MLSFKKRSFSYASEDPVGALWATTYSPNGRQIHSATWFGQILTHGKVMADSLPSVLAQNKSDFSEIGSVRNKGKKGDLYLDYWDQRATETTQEHRERLQSTLSAALLLSTVKKEAIEDLKKRLAKSEGL